MVGGGSTKAKKTWLREVANAEDTLAIRQPAVQLEEAVYGKIVAFLLVDQGRAGWRC